MYQNPDSKWAELPAELKNTGYSDRLLTHAALVATQGATHSPEICFMHANDSI
jgi:mediator of RNA polymerase II transcription subunit 16